MSFGKKSTNITSINDGGIICGATSSSASSDGPHPLPHVSEAGDEEIMISSGTKRTRSFIESDFTKTQALSYQKDRKKSANTHVVL